LVRASARSFLLRTNIFSLARPPRLTMHQLRPRRQWLHRTTSSIRIATSVQQKIHRYSAQLKGSAVFTIVDDVDGGFAPSVSTLIIIEGYNEMKKNLHPTVRQVVFKDVSCDFSFLGTSTMDSKETIKWEDGKNYPLIKVEISSASHPFFTGKQRVPDTEGRIGRFKKKYGKK
jgi:large subunit ribosomal protein L31